MRLSSNIQRPRNRQSGGTSKVPVTKYYRSGGSGAADSPFKPARRRKVKVWRYLVGFIDLCLIGALLVGLFYSLIVSPNAQVEASSLVYRPLGAYSQAAAAHLGTLKNRNKITLDERSVIAALQKQFPEISSAHVELPLFSQTPKLHLDIAGPSFFLSSNSLLYVVDSDGVAVAKTGDLPGIKNLAVVNDQSGFQAAAGQQVLSASNVNFINALLAQLKKAEVPLQSLSLPALAQELDLRTTDQPYFTKFYLGGGDVLVQSGQYLAARHQFSISGNQPGEYLDVRVPGKIFYK